MAGRAPIPLWLLAALALALAQSGCGGGHAPGRPYTRTTPLISIFQADAELLADPGRTLDTLKRLGVDRVRVFVPWGQLGAHPPITPDTLARTRPGGFDATDPAAYPPGAWAVYDQIDRAAAARGIGLDFTLAPPAPLWATQPGEPPAGNGTPGPIGVWKPSATDFGAFVHAVGRRYSGSYPDPLHPGRTLPRIDFWGVWNEPNLGIYLAPQAVDGGRLEVSPVYYRRLLDAAWAALEATGHGHDTILIGELAPRGSTVGPVPGNFDMMAPLRFLRALYCVDSSYRELRGAAAAARGCPTTAAGSAQFAREHPALFQATGVADHPYPQGQAPNVTTPLEPDYADFAALPRLERTLDRLQQAYGSKRRLPVYSTEFGYQTDPPDRLVRAVAPQTAADYMNLAEYLTWRDPRLRSYDQYLLEDPPGQGFASGLEFAGGAPKPSFFAYRMPLYLPVTSVRRGQALELWGCVRPLRYANRPRRVEIQLEPRGARRFRTIRAVMLSDPYGYFDVRQRFAASGTVRLRWSYPHGPAIFSRSVQVSVR